MQKRQRVSISLVTLVVGVGLSLYGLNQPVSHADSLGSQLDQNQAALSTSPVKQAESSFKSFLVGSGLVVVFGSISSLVWLAL